MLSTRDKIRIARAASRAVVGVRSLLGHQPIAQVSRHGANWSLDLSEGIDLALYLGLYQTIPVRVLDEFVRPGAFAIDIGANIGAHSLPLARRVGATGRVIAIEPTKYAFSRLAANAALNSDLGSRLILVQAALNDGTKDKTETKFYSRWPLHGSTAERHVKHLGQLESADGARHVTLDVLLGEMRAADRVDGPVTFVKLDVDGHEIDVLLGGSRTFEENRPAILIEIAPYVQDEVSLRFEAVINLLEKFGYRLERGESGKPLPMSAEGLRRIIKSGAGIDAVARPV